MTELVLIRGLPGSGKSTIARTMNTHVHIEADMFFINEDGEYCYNREKIQDAHEWCKRETFKSLANGNDVVVSNTFTRWFEIAPYFDIAKKFCIKPRIIIANGNYESIHNVPKETIEKMRNRWENFDD